MPSIPSGQVLLHLVKLPLLHPLLGVQLVDLGLEAPPMLPEPLVVEPLFF
jgi:hypothetical protein